MVPLAFHVAVDPQRVRGRGVLGAGGRHWDGRLELRGEEEKCLEETMRVLVRPQRPQKRLGVLRGVGGPIARGSVMGDPITR